jgi:hypothetical protein
VYQDINTIDILEEFIWGRKMSENVILDKIDIDHILDAMELWEQHEQQIIQTHQYLRQQYTDPEKLKEFDLITKSKIVELEEDVLSKRDMAIILKYKLVRMKESIDAQEIINKLEEIDRKLQAGDGKENGHESK